MKHSRYFLFKTNYHLLLHNCKKIKELLSVRFTKLGKIRQLYLHIVSYEHLIVIIIWIYKCCMIFQFSYLVHSDILSTYLREERFLVHLLQFYCRWILQHWNVKELTNKKSWQRFFVYDPLEQQYDQFMP